MPDTDGRTSSRYAEQAHVHQSIPESATQASWCERAGIEVIRNCVHLARPPQTRGEGNGSSPANSQGDMKDGDHHPPTTAMGRRPYLKPAFQYDIVFSKRLMRPTTKPVVG